VARVMIFALIGCTPMQQDIRIVTDKESPFCKIVGPIAEDGVTGSARLATPRSPRAAWARGISDDQFAADGKRLASITWPADRQHLMISYLAHRARNGPKILIDVLYAPLDTLQEIARLNEDQLVRMLEGMEKDADAQKPVQFSDAINSARKM